LELEYLKLASFNRSSARTGVSRGKGIGRKISRGGQQKTTKNLQKYRKIALFSLFQRGGNGKKTEKSQKRSKNSTFKPLSTRPIFVPCLKIQGGHVLLPTTMIRGRHHRSNWSKNVELQSGVANF